MPKGDAYNNKGGYKWCIKNWGNGNSLQSHRSVLALAKWNADEPELIERKRSLLYTFDTAWSPPLPVIIKMSKTFPQLLFTLKYWEGGMGFQGIFKAKNGKVLKDIHKPYKGHKRGNLIVKVLKKCLNV